MRHLKCAKYSLVLVFALVFCLIPVLPAHAATDGEYTYSEKSKRATITEYTGGGGDVVIPDQLDEYPVTSIGKEAFAGRNDITSIVIPEGVTSIGENAFSRTGLISITLPTTLTSIGAAAFSDCSKLPGIIIPDSVTKIGDYAFMGCTEVTDIVIPKSVTSIGREAFNACANLIRLVIPKKTTKIGKYAFAHCTNLTLIVVKGSSAEKYAKKEGIPYIIGDSSTEVSDDAVITTTPKSKNPPLTHTTEGYYTYRANTGVAGAVTIDRYTGHDAEVVIPDRLGGFPVVNVLGFDNHTEITSIVIPDGVYGVSLSDCTGLTSIHIPESVTDLRLSGCTSLTNVVIPENVTYLSLIDCTGLTSIDIPKSVTGLNLSGCTNLTSVVMPEITNMSAYGFGDCVGLTNVIIPKSVTEIAPFTFDGCTNLVLIVTKDSYAAQYAEEKGIPYIFDDGSTAAAIGDGAPNVSSGDYAAGGTSEILKVRGNSIDTSTFAGRTDLIDVIIPDSVTSIGTSAFYGCINLKNIVIPESVTSIEEYAFSGCTGLTNVVIPGSITSIGEGAFFGCTGLTSVVIPESATAIGETAFYGCTGLASAVIPESVTVIGEDAFSSWDSNRLVLLVKEGSYAEQYAKDNDLAYFFGDSSVELPTVAELPGVVITWSADKMVDKANELIDATGDSASIPEFVFTGWSWLTSIVIPRGVVSIEDGAFWGCSGLTNVVISEGVTSIGEFTFADCPKLISVIVPDSVNSISKYSFSDSEALSLTVKEGSYAERYAKTAGIPYVFGDAGTELPSVITIEVDTAAIDEIAKHGTSVWANGTGIGVGIGNLQFVGWSWLTSVTIPEDVTGIGAGAFYECTGLSRVTIPERVVWIGEEAFDNCPNLTLVVTEGSYAEQYAKKAGIPYAIGDSSATALDADNATDLSGAVWAVKSDDSASVSIKTFADSDYEPLVFTDEDRQFPTVKSISRATCDDTVIGYRLVTESTGYSDTEKIVLQFDIDASGNFVGVTVLRHGETDVVGADLLSDPLWISKLEGQAAEPATAGLIDVKAGALAPATQ